MSICFLPLKSSRSKLEVEIMGRHDTAGIMDRLQEALPKPNRARLSRARCCLKICTWDTKYIIKVTEIVLGRGGQFSTHAVKANTSYFREESDVVYLDFPGPFRYLPYSPKIAGDWYFIFGEVRTYNPEEIKRVKKTVLEHIMNDDIDAIFDLVSPFKKLRECFHKVIMEGW